MMKRVLAVFFGIVGLVTGYAQQPSTDHIADMEKRIAAGQVSNGQATVASGNFKVHFYQCYWQVDPAVNYIQGKVTAHFIVTKANSSIIFDFTHVLTVDSVLVHQQKIAFAQKSDESLSIQFGQLYHAGDQDSVTIYYQGIPPADNQAFVQSYHNGAPIIWTLSEPFGAKDWWPCRNGLDDKADSIDVYITHPAQYKATANGLLQSETTLNNYTTTWYKHRYPIASYLVAFAVSNYSIYSTHVQLGSTSMPLVYYAYPENLNDFVTYSYLVENALRLFNNVLGDYPFIKEQYGETQFGFGGGMEHQTNSFVQEVAANLEVHELAHQWFGDQVTCASWRDIWLNEGFATYLADLLYTEKADTFYYRRFVQYDLNTIVAQPGGSVWVDDTTNMDRIFDARLSYAKGAFLLRMLRWTLGDSAFFNGLRNYLADPALRYGFAKTADLQKHLEAAGNTNLDYFFNQWFYGQGYPSFTVAWQQNVNNYAHITVSQATSDASVGFFKVPLALTFKNSTQAKTVVINDTANTFDTSLYIGFAADTVLIDPDQQLISKNNTSTKLPEGTSATDDITVYPNPIGNQFTVSVKNPRSSSIQAQLFTIDGKRLFVNSYQLSGADVLLQVQPVLYLPHGVYVLVLDCGSRHVVKKLVKG